MSAIRQQRARQSRRQIPLSRTPTPPPITFQFAGLTSIQFAVNLSITRDQLVNTGIPQVRAVNVDQLPTSVTFLDSGIPEFPTTMLLIYPGALAPYETFVIPAYDPAVRSSLGGFISAGEVQTAPANPGVFDWSITADGSTVFILQMGGSVNSATLPDVTGISYGGPYQGMSAVRINETSFTVTGSGLLNPGDNVTWTPANGACYSQSAQQPMHQTVVAG